MRLSVTAAALLLLSGGAAPSTLEQRSGMNPSPVTLFEGMLRLAAAEDLPKLERSASLLGPVLADHRSIFGVDPTNALLDGLKSATRGQALRAVRLLVARDVVVILRAVPSAGPRAVTLARMATLEWRLLEEAAGQTDLRAAHSIASSMRDLDQAATNGDRVGARQIVPRLEKEILALFGNGAK